MKFALIFLVAFASTVPAFSQYNYGLTPTTLDGYRTSLTSNPDNELVDLEKAIPGIVLDIRYATTNNFTGAKIYNLAKAYARKPVAQALKKAQAEFNKRGYSIKIYDAYRPYSATVKFYEVMKGDTMYVANPYKGSRHNRGCALDMTIVDSKTKKELKMPTGYDAMEKDAWPTTAITDPEIKKNRETLISVMEGNGFKVYTTEWWHFDFVGYEKFDVMDIDFEKLEKIDPMNMTISDAQSQVDLWIKTHGVRYFNELTNMAMLTEEVGEVARIMARRYGEQSEKESDKDKDLGDEMADVLWVLICLANQTGVDLTKAFEKNLEKKTARDKNRHHQNPKLK